MLTVGKNMQVIKGWKTSDDSSVDIILNSGV